MRSASSLLGIVLQIVAVADCDVARSPWILERWPSRERRVNLAVFTYRVASEGSGGSSDVGGIAAVAGGSAVADPGSAGPEAAGPTSAVDVADAPDFRVATPGKTNVDVERGSTGWSGTHSPTSQCRGPLRTGRAKLPGTRAKS